MKTTVPAESSPEGSSGSGGASKTCVVCGDKSYGLNFNAITCESCKAFFRRNALSKKDLVCPFSNACNVTRVTRRFCQKCRLMKCFAVGMNKEHIMSEEEKQRKRKKIESNRARKIASGVGASEEPPVKVKRESGDGSETGADLEDGSLHSLVKEDTTSVALSPGAPSGAVAPASTPEDGFVWPTKESPPTQIVDSIINSPVGSRRIINHLMRNPEEAIQVMEKIIKSPKDAIHLISHFINTPGDALTIISKIMDSPLDALTIFTKFMSSPTDALEVITKVIQSPNDVLQFLQQLMRHPEDGLEIMQKFMSSPAEALRMINSMMNQTTRVDSTTGGSASATEGQEGDGGIETAFIEIQPSDSIMNSSAQQLKVMLDRMGEHLSGGEGSPTSNLPSSSTLEEESECVGVTEVLGVPEGPGGLETPHVPLFGQGDLSGGLLGGQTTTQDIIDMLINQSVSSMDSVVLSEAIKLEYECTLPMVSGMPNASPSMYLSPSVSGMNMSNGDGRALNEVEQAKLNELIVAHQALYAPVHEDISSLIADDYRLKVSQQGWGNEWFGWIKSSL